MLPTANLAQNLLHKCGLSALGYAKGGASDLDFLAGKQNKESGISQRKL